MNPERFKKTSAGRHLWPKSCKPSASVRLPGENYTCVHKCIILLRRFIHVDSHAGLTDTRRHRRGGWAGQGLPGVRMGE